MPEKNVSLFTFYLFLFRFFVNKKKYEHITTLDSLHFAQLKNYSKKKSFADISRLSFYDSKFVFRKL